MCFWPFDNFLKLLPSVALPKTNISLENRPTPKRKVVFWTINFQVLTAKLPGRVNICSRSHSETGVIRFPTQTMHCNGIAWNHSTTPVKHLTKFLKLFLSFTPLHHTSLEINMLNLIITQLKSRTSSSIHLHFRIPSLQFGGREGWTQNLTCLQRKKNAMPLNVVEVEILLTVIWGLSQNPWHKVH